ncbi:hypothetical protein CELD12_17490 [Cellulomonas sp. NTE-D12]|nr:hypothetical protein CELD12_17490 [Cellulomonas sp. NTE-D12]
MSLAPSRLHGEPLRVQPVGIGVVRAGGGPAGTADEGDERRHEESQEQEDGEERHVSSVVAEPGPRQWQK